MAKMKASGIEVDAVGDKTPFQNAVKPVGTNTARNTPN
jgi:hypothetical protein